MIISDKDKKKRTSGGLRIFIGRDDSGNLVSLSKKGKIIHVFRGEFRQDVLALVDKVLLGGGEKIQDVKEIAVDRGPGGFSEVRGRIATAAALMTSLSISTALVHGMTAEEVASMPSSYFRKTRKIAAIYDGQPNITKSKRKKLI